VLPLKNHNGRVCVDWANSLGMDIEFICGSIEGFVTIISYDKKTCFLEIKYKDTLFKIATYHFLKGQISNLVGLKTTRYRHSVGELVNNLKILEHIRYGKGKYKTKGYLYECVKDGYKGEVSETGIISGVGCPVCSNNLIVEGINDIATTNPEIVHYFKNKNDAFKYSIGTKTRIECQCIYCGQEKTASPIVLSNHLFKCSKCGDGVSYPEKFMFSLLEQLNEDFISQKMFKWSERKVYDFYIPSKNLIIETHGSQHYKEASGNWNSLSEIKRIDSIKKENALNKGVKHYITIDCSESDISWIKENIIKSKISGLYDLNNIDWLKCHEIGCSSNIKKTCELWNSGIYSSREIAKIMKLSRSTVLNYIEKGLVLKWFN